MVSGSGLRFGGEFVEDILESFEDLSFAGQVGSQVIAMINGLDLGEGLFEALQIGASVFYVLWRVLV